MIAANGIAQSVDPDVAGARSFPMLSVLFRAIVLMVVFRWWCFRWRGVDSLGRLSGMGCRSSRRSRGLYRRGRRWWRTGHASPSLRRRRDMGLLLGVRHLDRRRRWTDRLRRRA